MDNSGKYGPFKPSVIITALFLSSSALATVPDYSVLGFEAPREGLLGDLGGLRSGLQARGFTYSLGYLSQTAVNMAGGYNSHSKAEYIDQFSLTFNQDLQALTGIPDAAIEGNIVNRNHNSNLTVSRLQNPSIPFNDLAQESWGGQSITRLGWLTFSRSFLDHRLSWRVGLINKVQTFDQSIPCDFQVLSQCGGKSANAMLWNNWNVHSWGTTLAYKLTPEWTLKAGVMEQNPRVADRSHAWSWSTRGSRGALFPVEAELKTQVNGLPGVYNLGALLTNARQQHLSRGVSQQDGSRDPQGYLSYSTTGFIWASANQQVTRHPDDAARGMSVSWSGSFSDQRTNRVRMSTSVSMRYRGLLDARPEDWLGLGVSYIKMSGYANEQLRFASQGLPPGVNGYPAIGHSVNAELYYRIRATSWLELQPDIQYWHNPGGAGSTPDAWVAGLKTVVSF